MPFARFAPALLLAALGTWLFWGPALPPFQDMPAHAALIALRARLAIPGVDVEHQAWTLAPLLGPYSMFRGLGALLAPHLGPLGSVRALASLAWLAWPAALAYARWRLTRSITPRELYAGMALGLGLCTLLGLTSFQLGVVLALAANADWLAHLTTPTRASALRVTTLTLLVLFTHGFAFVLLLAIATIALYTYSRAQYTLRTLAPWIPATLLAIGALWAVATLHTVAPASDWAPRYEGALAKLKLLLAPTLMTRYGADAAMSLPLWWLTARALAKAPADPIQRALRLQIVTLLVGFTLAPHAVGWFGFLDARLLPLAMALACLLDLRPSRWWPIAACVNLSSALIACVYFAHEATGATETLAKIPTGTRLLHLPIDPDSASFAVHPFLHYDKLAMLERPLLVSDLWTHQGSAVYPRPGSPVLTLPRTPHSVISAPEWDRYRWQEWDYVLIRSRAEPAPPAQLRLEHHVGGFWLYRTPKPE